MTGAVSAGNIVSMSALIVAGAASARAAQAIMSTGADPMTIKEFKFTVNHSVDWQFGTETDLKLNFWRLGLNQKISTDYKRHFGVEIECTIVPSVTIDST